MSVVDTNTRKCSKSSINDLEGDVFHIAPNLEKVAERPKGGRILFKSFHVKDEKPRRGRIANPVKVSEVSTEIMTTTSTT